MSESTKAKINIKEGVIELEGSEEFVQKNLDEFRGLISIPSAQLLNQEKAPIDSTKKKNHKVVKKGINISPIPLDFHNNSKTLKDFFKEKFPEGSKNNQEITTLFVYYLDRILSLPEVSPGHIVSCYNEVDLKKPLNIPQLFRDITSSKGWIESSKTSGCVQITIAGENLIEHSLPRKAEKEIHGTE